MAMRPTALLLALVVCALAASAGATQFKVGGQSGWSVPGAGSESYNTWAGRLRFQIGDQLLFVYPKETDSVLLVDPAAYNACNTTSYLARFDDGSTVFKFVRSGPFFFVSGNEASCRANQKLIVVVLADRSGARTPPAAPPPTSSPAPVPSPPGTPPAAAPGASPPSSSPPSPGAAPAAAPGASPPSSSPPSPGAAPAATPASPPSPAASAPAPAPTTTTPSSPPAPAAQAPSPSTTPTPGGGASSPPSASANAPAGEGGGSSSTTPPPPSAAAPVVAGFVGSLGAFIGYAMLAA